jgi:hypothetical protein
MKQSDLGKSLDPTPELTLIIKKLEDQCEDETPKKVTKMSLHKPENSENERKNTT